MFAASVLLVVIGLLGAFDVAYFHTYRGRLVERPESRREAWLHVARGVVYAIQFLVVPNLRLTGAWFGALFVLFAIDVAVAVADVLEEPRSRASQGGLSGGEYLMHIVLSVLVGAMLSCLVAETARWPFEPTALTFEPRGPAWLRLLAALMAGSSALVAALEALAIVERTLPPPEPLHVRVRLAAAPERVWAITQDHRLHPRWDHRFDRIVLAPETVTAGEPRAHEAEPAGEPRAHEAEPAGELWAPEGVPDPRIGTGTMMRYEKRVLGVTIRGYGRYKLHRPMRQSTFEFWSDDGRSLLRRGVGLWLYTPRPGGGTEFSTSYTYETRWGLLGRVVDRWFFRPLFQRYTEQSFRRLARGWFGEARPLVLGREGRRPRRFPARDRAGAAA
jgi:hypothetical protein